MTLRDVTWRDVTWRDVTWRDVMWCDVTWRDVTWPDLTWPDLTWADVAWRDLTWCGVAWRDLTWPDAMRSDLFIAKKLDIWCDMTWCAMSHPTALCIVTYCIWRKTDQKGFWPFFFFLDLNRMKNSNRFILQLKDSLMVNCSQDWTTENMVYRDWSEMTANIWGMNYYIFLIYTKYPEE